MIDLSVASGFVIGLVFGVVGLLSGFCLMSSLRDLWTTNDTRKIRSYATALAVAIAGTQLLAGALGPLLASFIVSDADVYGAVWLGTGLILSGLVLMGALHITALRARKKLLAV